MFRLKLALGSVATYQFSFKDEVRARAFVHDLTKECVRLCIYRTGTSVTVLDGSDLGQREQIYACAWVHQARIPDSSP